MIRVLTLTKDTAVGAVVKMDGKRWVIAHIGEIDDQKRVLLTCKQGNKIHAQSLLAVVA